MIMAEKDWKTGEIYANELQSGAKGQTFFDNDGYLRTDTGELIEDKAENSTIVDFNKNVPLTKKGSKIMSENIKEALEYAVDLSRDAEPILIDDAGDEWYDANRHNMKPLESPVYLPKTLELSTLTGFVDYIKSGLNELNEQNLIVQVAGPRLVNVYAEDEAMYKNGLTWLKYLLLA